MDSKLIVPSSLVEIAPVLRVAAEVEPSFAAYSSI